MFDADVRPVAFLGVSESYEDIDLAQMDTRCCLWPQRGGTGCWDRVVAWLFSFSAFLMWNDKSSFKPGNC